MSALEVYAKNLLTAFAVLNCPRQRKEFMEHLRHEREEVTVSVLSLVLMVLSSAEIVRLIAGAL